VSPRPFLAVLALGLAGAAAAVELTCGANAPLDTPVQLDYAVTASRGGLSIGGDAALVFQRRSDGYELRSTQKALGLIEARQSSAGGVGKQGLAPREFTQQSGRRPLLRVDFDWSARQVTFSQSGESAPTRPQMQDRLSVLLQLAWRVRAAPAAAAIELPVAVQRSVSTYAFTAAGAETVEVPAGRFETVKYERHRPDGDDLLEVWLAPALCHFPVRLRASEDRSLVIEQQLRAVRPLP